MFDELCSALRDVIHDAIDESINGFTEVECLLAERNVNGVTMTIECIEKYIERNTGVTLHE